MFFASLGIIGGVGLFSYKSWARILVMIVSAINCLNIPDRNSQRGLFHLGPDAKRNHRAV